MIRLAKRRVKWHIPPPVIHLLIWLFLYLVPIVLGNQGSEEAWRFRYWTTIPFLAIIIAFYANFSFLIPKFLFEKKRILYIFINLLIFAAALFLISIWRDHVVSIGVIKIKNDNWLFKSVISYVFTIGIAMSAYSTTMWFRSKDTMYNLELENIRSELSFLKMQISPHFLFNTLNNILTLIDENKELAKESVLQLSKLLRSVLYESENDTVTIKQEIEFLTNYSNLMRLRYGLELNFKLETDLCEPDAPIAPLLLMPLLENVFKHGICNSVKDSFINIKISSKNGKIIYESTNTYFPKTPQDKSGSGIGIANMQKRLALLYENRFYYDCKIDGENYITKLELQYDPSN
ncbi:MAG: histidine kinase [Fibromonadaceae bacterium]|jgi:LytS/YehU family sensor histidine kinase|nr:histidine kinase [Fibromonadaceae bacterium]